jgi:hypothetical protein
VAITVYTCGIGARGSSATWTQRGTVSISIAAYAYSNVAPFGNVIVLLAIAVSDLRLLWIQVFI